MTYGLRDHCWNGVRAGLGQKILPDILRLGEWGVLTGLRALIPLDIVLSGVGGVDRILSAQICLVGPKFTIGPMPSPALARLQVLFKILMSVKCPFVIPEHATAV